MIPVSICLFRKALVRMWLIVVAFILVTLVGLMIRGIKLFSDAKLTKFFTFTLFLLSRTLMLKSPTKQRFLLFLRILSKIGFKEFLNFLKTRIRWLTNLTKNDVFFC